MAEKYKYKDFIEDINLNANSEGDFKASTMFYMYNEIAREFGYIDEDLTHCPYKSTGLQVDGYYFDSDLGELVIAVCDYKDNEELDSLNTKTFETFFKRAENFFEKSLDEDWINTLEESDESYALAYLIYSNKRLINKIRFNLFSNSRLASNASSIKDKNNNNINYVYNILDFTQFSRNKNSSTGYSEIEIDIKEMGFSPLSFLDTGRKTEEYEAILLVLPCELLANIYSKYKARLLEQNVRSFLQARGKVNKGIIETLKSKPHMFFAYNNGITATAAEIIKSKDKNGRDVIEKIKNLQIVNGGQTTAATLYARDREKADLSNAYVQVKLSIVKPAQMDEVVPKISRFANMQNKLQEADFFANHAFHIRLEEFSRNISAPIREGALNTTKWFYERARGQYADESAYLPEAQKKRFKLEHPKNQLITKTDLSKILTSFDRMPHVVSKGATASFIYFANQIAKVWEKSNTQYNERWFKETIAKAIIFRSLDKLILNADWYTGGGIKATCITYTIAWLSTLLKESGKSLDLIKIWNNQSIENSFEVLLNLISKNIYKELVRTDELNNITQWGKRQACWNNISSLKINFDDSMLENILIDKDIVAQERIDAINEQAQTNELNAVVEVVTLGIGYWNAISRFAISRRMMTGNIQTTIHKINRGQIPADFSCKALLELKKQCEDLEFEFNE